MYNLSLSGIPFDPVAFFRDYVLPGLAIIIPIAVYLIYQRKKKEFNYAILSKESLFEVHDEVRDKLEILYEERNIENIHLVIIKFENHGNVPIEPDDFDKGVIIEFNDEAQILSNEVIERKPSVLNYGIKGEGNKFWLDPTLFNQGDYITIKMLISEFVSIKNIFGRIIVVSEIKEVTEEPRLNSATRLIGVIIIGYSILAYLIFSPEISYSPSLLLLVSIMTLIGLIAISFPPQFRIVIRSLKARFTRKRRNT